MQYDFDQVIDRSGTYSSKWSKFDPDVLPFWVADMDFAAPEFILQVLHERLKHPILGYTVTPDSLQQAFQSWLQHHFDWDVPEEWVVWVPGVVPGLNLAAQAMPRDAALLLPTPVYFPFLDLAAHAGCAEIRVPMRVEATASGALWRMDFDAMARALTPATRMLMICNPQNPTGRCYSADELSELARFVETHDLLLVSDEIHCNIILDANSQHLPIAAVHPEIAARTISLYAATKIYNIPGLSCAAAVIPDPQLRQRFIAARAGLVPGIGPLGFTASEIAFNDRSGWVPQLLTYLRGNLQLLSSSLGTRLARLEGTYLAWIDVRDLALRDPEAYFANYGVGINPGEQFGTPGYVRFNFGCPRQTLRTGLARLQDALNA